MPEERKLEAVPDLPGAVLLNQPEITILGEDEITLGDLTFIDVTGLAFSKATAYQESSESPAAKREYAMAKTALEDATMRFNRARSIDLGCFHVADTESPEFLAALTSAQAERPETEGGEVNE